ncbi:MAG: hypothetical protein PHC43_01160 [Candidatus Marinimicrobia bacterium]|nr:hypothetical protein [Candidatus Neomarinimicrobiota bacterium]
MPIQEIESWPAGLVVEWMEYFMLKNEYFKNEMEKRETEAKAKRRR